eukprot:COSAG05_NODE_97_length_19444_cov_8.577174_8_plen_60_part_00
MQNKLQIAPIKGPSIMTIYHDHDNKKAHAIKARQQPSRSSYTILYCIAWDMDCTEHETC